MRRFKRGQTSVAVGDIYNSTTHGWPFKILEVTEDLVTYIVRVSLNSSTINFRPTQIERDIVEMAIANGDWKRA